MPGTNSKPEALQSGLIAIMTAMDCELAELLSATAISATEKWNGFSLHRGRLCEQEVILVRSGCGKVRSAMVAQHLIDGYKPRCLIFTGLAGALNKSYEIGDIIIGSDYVQHDMDAIALGFKRGQIPYEETRFLSCDENLIKLAQTYSSSEHAVRFGRVLTGDQFLTHADVLSHRYLTEELAGDAVDMEGASVGLVCHLNHVPYLLLRTVSDRADSNAPLDFNAFIPLASRHSVQFVKYILSKL